jgi:P27 family predicted phage terminase small subunit
MRNAPGAPAHLSAEERATWNEIVASRPSTLWGPADLHLLHEFVRTLSDLREYERVLGIEGRTVASASGVPKLHPYVRARESAQRLLMSLATKLRLSASTRFGNLAADRAARYAEKGRALQSVLDADDDDLLATRQ